MKSINPYNGQLIKEYPADDFASVKKKLSELYTTFDKWRKLTLEQRIAIINSLANILEENKAEYAYMITLEMGKVKAQAIKEIEKCVTLCKYYAENAKEFLAKKNISTAPHSSYIIYEPLGIICGIMPWNFPFWQVFRFAIPTLLAGNVVILKHASMVSGCALAIERLFNSATKTINLAPYSTILYPSEKMAQVIADPLIQAVSLTSSVDAGKNVASIAGKLLKKTVLELSGSDPYIILSDANLDAAVKACVTGRLVNTGQSCVAAKRFIVVTEVYDTFLAMLTEEFKKLKIGDPNLDDTDIGPLANEQILNDVAEQVKRSVDMGATCHYGGKRIGKEGYLFQPTILTDIPKNSPAYSDEIFGPVACVFKAETEEAAIFLANDSDFDLGAAVFSQNIEHAVAIGEHEINAGMVFINSNVVSDPRLPFGGIKHSGYGRELSEFGIHEFVNIKTIVVSKGNITNEIS